MYQKGSSDLTINCPLPTKMKSKILYHQHCEDVGAAMQTFHQTFNSQVKIPDYKDTINLVVKY
jgi:hypothetical protein